MLLIPPHGLQTIESHVSDTTNETATFSISVTAGTSLAKNATYTELVASTAKPSFGISIMLAGLQTAANSNNRCLVDIAIGGVGSEIVIIPNLDCGNVADFYTNQTGAVMYFFPIYIPAGSRISATAAASTDSDIVNVAVRLYQHPTGPGGWYGHRVTAYGADTANVRGTSHTPGQNSYAAATQLTASTTNPIRYMQLGYDGLSDTTLTNARYLARIGYGATPTYLVSGLPIMESTGIESLNFTHANFILSQMRFGLPAGQSLHISAMRDISAPEARGFIVYGVD